MTELTATPPSSGARVAALRLRGDAGLGRLVGRGDRQAFAVVYERYHQPLYRYCLSILRNPEDASDALQSTMANALRAMTDSGHDVSLRPWLFRIAHNEAVSVLRRRRQHEELSEEHAPAAADVASDARVRERLSELVSDLAALPNRQRGALVMRELSGLGYDEIAAVLEVSPAAAKQTVYEARKGLHEIDDGRGMECEHARQVISARDGRLVRGRKVRAHLRTCEGCRSFKASVEARPAQLAALAPPLETSTAAAVLASVLGAGGQGGGSGGGLLAGLTGAGASVPAAGKVLAVLAAVAATGTIAVAGVRGARDESAPSLPSAAKHPELVTAPRPDESAPPATERASESRRPRRHTSSPGASASSPSPSPPAAAPAGQEKAAARTGGSGSRLRLRPAPPGGSSSKGSNGRDADSSDGDPTAAQLPDVPVSVPETGIGTAPLTGEAAPDVPAVPGTPAAPDGVAVPEPSVEVPAEAEVGQAVKEEDTPVELPDLAPKHKG